MNTKCILISFLLFAAATGELVRAQGTAFTYQGSLQNNGAPASGMYDIAFTLFGSTNGGSAIAGPITNSPTAVSNGLFTVTLDFGSAPFTGGLRWLEIAVRTNGGGTFATLTPRQQLTPTPYAIFAGTASNLSGTVSSSQIAGTYSNPVNFNNGADTFDGSFYGQFFGSTFIGGSFVGSFLGSGSGLGDVWHTGGNIGTTSSSFLGTTDYQPLLIKVNGQQAQRFEPTLDAPNIIGGYNGNYVQPGLSGVTIGGGGSAVFFAGKTQPNLVTNNGQFGVIAGGYNNVVSNYGGAILGGSVHLNGGHFGVIGGGQFHTNLGDYSFMGGGSQNLIDVNAGYSVLAGGSFNSILSNAPQSVIGGGNVNAIMVSANESVIGGGSNNTNASSVAFIGGGYFNVVQSNSLGASVVAGFQNIIQTNSGWSSIGGGYGNLIDSFSIVSSIGGGFQNLIQGDSNRWSGNIVFGSTIGGGAVNNIQYLAAYSTIAGGIQNTIETNGQYSTIGGGVLNRIQTNGIYDLIGGGYLNQIVSNAWIATISGGYSNQAGYGGTVPGGRDNSATGRYSFAAGRSARATNDGSFVLADNQAVDFYSTASNQLSARFSGGIALQTAGTGLTLDGLPVIAGVVPGADLTGIYPNPVTFNNAGNNFSGNGAGLTGVNASTLNGVASSGFWSTTGNAGTSAGANYIGTSDNQPLLIKGSFVGVGRSFSIGSEYFGIDVPAPAGAYGGMYINAANATAKPFYGYSLANGAVRAWQYLDGNDTNKWKLYNNGDRITVTANGLVGIATTTPDSTLTVNGIADKPGGGSWAVFSDARLKKNVQPLEGALDRLLRLQGVTFEYKDPSAIHELPGTQIGMIAQEVEKVFPDWVDTAATGMKRLSVHGFEALTVEALRDLRQEKDSQVAELKATNTEIRNENAKLQKELAAQKEAVSLLETRLGAVEKALNRRSDLE